MALDWLQHGQQMTAEALVDAWLARAMVCAPDRGRVRDRDGDWELYTGFATFQLMLRAAPDWFYNRWTRLRDG